MSARLLALADAVIGLVAGQRGMTRSATAEFGLTPAVRYAHELDQYTDAELIQFDALAEVRRTRECAEADADRDRDMDASYDFDDVYAWDEEAAR